MVATILINSRNHPNLIWAVLLIKMLMICKPISKSTSNKQICVSCMKNWRIQLFFFLLYIFLQFQLHWTHLCDLVCCETLCAYQDRRSLLGQARFRWFRFVFLAGDQVSRLFFQRKRTLAIFILRYSIYIYI